jgi:actin-related protein
MFEHVAHHCFSELEMEPESTGVVVPEPPYNPRQCTEQIAQTFFEAFGVPQMAVVPSGICALYASGRTTGVVLDSGGGVTHISPVFDSYIIQNATNRINHGGEDVTEHLKNILFERGLNFTTPQDELLVRRIKENMCYVSPNYESEMKTAVEALANFDLPDGQTICLGKERFRAPEILFSPFITLSELPSLQELCANAVKSCGIDIRKQLLGNIVLCGGNTLFPGIGKRLEEEVLRYFPGLFGSVNVIESPDRLFSSWAGASVLASLPSFGANIVTKEVYDEHGPSIVRGYNKGHVEGEDAEVSLAEE